MLSRRNFTDTDTLLCPFYITIPLLNYCLLFSLFKASEQDKKMNVVMILERERGLLQ
jgi:prepilin signal peptidase PulO-like enzyme (type II secretory pathway)